MAMAMLLCSDSDESNNLQGCLAVTDTSSHSGELQSFLALLLPSMISV